MEDVSRKTADREALHAHFLRRMDEIAALVAAQSPPPPAAPIPVIYYVQVGAHIKVGWTSNLGKRMRQYPPNSQLLAVHPGTRTEERALHRKFAVWRSHGREWYPLVPVLLDHIKRMVAEHGEPDVQTFGAKPVEVPEPRPSQPMRMRGKTRYGIKV